MSLWWLDDKLRPVEPRVKGWPKKGEVIVIQQHAIELKYSQLQSLSSKIVDRISSCFPPHIHRFLAAIPQANPQIFRAFSASFAHRIGLAFFRSLCAANSQDLTN